MFTNESERVSKQEIEMAEGFIEKTCDKLSHACETIGEEISSIDCSRVSGGGGSGDGGGVAFRGSPFLCLVAMTVYTWQRWCQ